MKSVVEVAFSGSWFCSSLTSRLRNSFDVNEEVDEELDDDVVVVAVEVDVVAATVIEKPRFVCNARCERVRLRLKSVC
ncbi:hypothetical protein GCM10007857_18040 [Bradyrhizobium iriomotense]|uniref:Uncharacterized protein n=1 Tax=Bradyrhizobium iriomotense TaxID=441950 RepID=A0ABQ6ASG5_9BRAD|nr:hypothetical protein GCM10007857_18040 [Bradyrhizobium iriomotense]